MVGRLKFLSHGPSSGAMLVTESVNIPLYIINPTATDPGKNTPTFHCTNLVTRDPYNGLFPIWLGSMIPKIQRIYPPWQPTCLPLKLGNPKRKFIFLPSSWDGANPKLNLESNNFAHIRVINPYYWVDDHSLLYGNAGSHEFSSPLGANWCAFGANAKPAMLKSRFFQQCLTPP